MGEMSTYDEALKALMDSFDAPSGNYSKGFNERQHRWYNGINLRGDVSKNVYC
jgi:hypothetical protein